MWLCIRDSRQNQEKNFLWLLNSSNKLEFFLDIFFILVLFYQIHIAVFDTYSATHNYNRIIGFYVYTYVGLYVGRWERGYKISIHKGRDDGVKKLNNIYTQQTYLHKIFFWKKITLGILQCVSIYLYKQD